jgi:hypothetical protein
LFRIMSGPAGQDLQFGQLHEEAQEAEDRLLAGVG